MLTKKILSTIYRKCEQILSGSQLGRSSIVKAISRCLRSYLKSDFVEIEGRQMFLDSNDSLRLSINRVYEPSETKTIKTHVKKGDVVLDIGANIGYYTLIFAELVGEKGKVYAFEPDPTNFDLLRKNVEINGYRNITLIQKAVSNKNGKISFYSKKTNSWFQRF